MFIKIIKLEFNIYEESTELIYKGQYHEFFIIFQSVKNVFEFLEVTKHNLRLSEQPFTSQCNDESGKYTKNIHL